MRGQEFAGGSCDEGHDGGVFYVRAWPEWDPEGRTEPWMSAESASENNMIRLAESMTDPGAWSSVEVFHTRCEEAIWSWPPP